MPCRNECRLKFTREMIFDSSENDMLEVEMVLLRSLRLDDVDLAGENLSLGYIWYGKKFQGTGLNKDCKYLPFEFIFEQLGFERVEFRLDSRNERSLNAIKSLGCMLKRYLQCLPDRWQQKGFCHIKLTETGMV